MIQFGHISLSPHFFMREGIADRVRGLAEEKRRKETAQQEENNAVRSQREAVLRDEESLQTYASSEDDVQIYAERDTYDERIAEVRELLAILTASHEEAQKSVGGARAAYVSLKEKTGQLDTLLNALMNDKDAAAVLGDLQITSADDILHSAEFSDAPEVVAVRNSEGGRKVARANAKEAIAKRKEQKGQAKNALEQENVETEGGTYPHILAGLQQLVSRLENERYSLHEKTSEGRAELQDREEREREAKKAEILAGVRDRRENPGGGFFREIPEVDSLGRIHGQMTYRPGDGEDAKKYGDDAVKSAIKEYYHGAVDTALSKEAEVSGQAQFSEDVRTLDALPAKWREVRTQLSTVEQGRQKAISSIVALGEEDAQLLENMRAFGNYRRGVSAQDLATALVTQFASYPALAFNIDTYNATIEKQIEALCRGEEDGVVRTMQAGGVLGRVTPKNPERALRALESLEAVYQIVQGLSKEKLNDFLANHMGSSAVVASINATVSADVRRIPTELSFGTTLRDQWGHASVDVLRQRAVKFEVKQKERTTELRSQIDDKVELDWSAEELNAFLREAPNTRWTNYGLVEQVRKIKELQVAGEKLLRSADTLVGRGVPLQEMIDAEVVVNPRGEVHFVEHDLSKCVKDREALLSKIRPINQEITAIRERAGREGDGFFGAKKKAREREIATLQVELGPLDRQFATVEAALTLAKEQDAKLEKMREWMKATKATGFEIYPNEGTQTRTVAQTVADFKECIAKVQPTEEQEELFARYQTLQEKADSAKRVYDQKWPGRRSY